MARPLSAPSYRMRPRQQPCVGWSGAAWGPDRQGLRTSRGRSWWSRWKRTRWWRVPRPAARLRGWPWPESDAASGWGWIPPCWPCRRGRVPLLPLRWLPGAGHGLAQARERPMPPRGQPLSRRWLPCGAGPVWPGRGCLQVPLARERPKPAQGQPAMLLLRCDAAAELVPGWPVQVLVMQRLWVGRQTRAVLWIRARSRERATWRE